MKSKHSLNHLRASVLIIVLAVSSFSRLKAQNLSFGVFADPVISWFSTDTKEIRNKGARAGFNFGFTFNKYFSNNYAFSSGLNIMNAGGRLVNSSAITMTFNNFDSVVPAGKPVIYMIRYLSIPLGLKFKTNQIGYLTFFSDLGLDPKIVIGGKVDIPALDITSENAIKELNAFNLAYHITGGLEYSLGGTTAMVLGLGFENNFLDITKELNSQPVDKVSHKILRFRIGLIF